MGSSKLLVKRFPQMKREIALLERQNPDFRQLMDDYKDLVRSLRNVDEQSASDKEDIQNLKTMLELEALELLLKSKTM